MFYDTFETFKERAFQLADLTNSYFITNEELNNIANDVWRQVYADLIFIGDKFYLKEKDITGDATVDLDSLGDDFFSLDGVYGVTHNIITPFLRRSGTQKLDGNLYDIIGKELRLYNKQRFDKVVMQYFPVPLRLFGNSVVSASKITDMPNNIFSQYLIYKTAIQLKIKQGADANGLIMLADDMWNTYLQTLNRDNFGLVRIQNVYGCRGWR